MRKFIKSLWPWFAIGFCSSFSVKVSSKQRRPVADVEDDENDRKGNLADDLELEFGKK